MPLYMYINIYRLLLKPAPSPWTRTLKNQSLKNPKKHGSCLTSVSYIL